MIEYTVNSIKTLCRYDMLIEQTLIQIAFARIFKLHVAFGWNFTEAAVARHNDKPLDKMDYDAGTSSRLENRIQKKLTQTYGAILIIDRTKTRNLSLLAGIGNLFNRL